MDMNPLLQQGNAQVPIPQVQPTAQNPQMPQISMAGVLDNPASSIMAAPPSNPQEVDSRKQAWSQLLEDPNLKSAILRMGLNLLQGQRPGESVGGTVGRTATDAMDYYGFKNELDRKKALEDQKAALEQQNVQSEIGQRTAQTQQTQQQTSDAAAKMNEWTNQADLRRQTAQQTVDNLITQGKVNEAQLLADQFKNEETQRLQAFKDSNPDLTSQSYGAELQKPIQAISLAKAQTQEASSAAGRNQAEAGRINQQTQDLKDKGAAMPDWIDALKGDEEAQLYAQIHKDTESQTQILNDISQGKHHGLSRKLDKASAGTEDYTPLVATLAQQYAGLAPTEKAKYPTLSSFIVDQIGNQMSPGSAKPLNQTLRAVPNAPIQYVRDPKTGKLVPQ